MDMMFNAIRIHSAPEALAQQIVDQIKNRKIDPGAPLPSQRELAKLFQVGLGTVREALKILNAMGWVEILRGVGTYVRADALTRQPDALAFADALEAVSLVELMTAREVVECGAARLAAQTAHGDSVRGLRDITARMASVGVDSDAYYENDFKFHIAVAEASENQALIEIVKLLIDKSHSHVDFMDNALGISQPANMHRCIGSAIRVVDCIAAGAAEDAAEAMQAHLATVNRRLMKGLGGEWKTS